MTEGKERSSRPLPGEQGRGQHVAKGARENPTCRDVSLAPLPVFPCPCVHLRASLEESARPSSKRPAPKGGPQPPVPLLTYDL